MVDAPIYFDWPGKIWLISDPHFGDVGMLKFERTQFKNIDEHDNFIINIINNRVNKGDTIVFLGDMGRNWKKYIDMIKENVYKVLILGNHDKLTKNQYTDKFNEVYSGPLFINNKIVLSHEPIPVSEHFLNIHGHLHNSYLDDDHHLNISIHMVDYKLQDYDKIYKKTMNYKKIKAQFLKEWYADKYVFTNLLRRDVFLYNDGHIVPKNIVDEFTKKFVGDEYDRLRFIRSDFSKNICINKDMTVNNIVELLEIEYNEGGWNNE